jgi:hypothetical protein
MKVICNKRFSCDNAQTCEQSKVHEQTECRPCGRVVRAFCKRVIFRNNALIRIDESKDTLLAKMGLVEFNEYNAAIYEDENGNQLAVFKVMVFSVFKCCYIVKNVCLENDFKVVCLTFNKEVVS